MPPEELNCLLALNMEMHGEDAALSGVRVFAFADDLTTVSWYTACSESPLGYESILDGLVYVRSDTIESMAHIDRVTPTKIDSAYQWNDTAQKDGLMIAVALPKGYSIARCDPQLEEAKRFGDGIAVYWVLRPANSSDPKVTVRFSIEPCGESVDNEVDRLNRIVTLSRARPATVQYDVTLSFAGEDRKYVDRVAEGLAAEGFKVFYDNFEEADLSGKDLYSHLSEVYGSRARLTVMFVSAAYGAKLWTNHARRAAQAKAFTQNSEYILPVRIDDTDIPGMLPNISYVHANQKAPEELASLLILELARFERSSVSASVTSKMAASTAKGENCNESGTSVEAADQRVITAGCNRNSAGGVAAPKDTVSPIRYRRTLWITSATLLALVIGSLVALYKPLGSLPGGAGIPAPGTTTGGVTTAQAAKDPVRLKSEGTVLVSQTQPMETPRTTENEALSPREANMRAADAPRAGVSSTRIPKTGKQVYVAVCKACHDTGALGSPKITDSKAWESRLVQGKTALYMSALNGKGIMPARGGAKDLRDEEIGAGVDFMLTRIARAERIGNSSRFAQSPRSTVSDRVTNWNQTVAKRTPSTVRENWAASLRVGLARCKQRGLIEQVICTEKARWRYCNPGRWGTVQECAAATGNSARAY